MLAEWVSKIYYAVTLIFQPTSNSIMHVNAWCLCNIMIFKDICTSLWKSVTFFIYYIYNNRFLSICLFNSKQCSVCICNNTLYKLYIQYRYCYFAVSFFFRTSGSFNWMGQPSIWEGKCHPGPYVTLPLIYIIDYLFCLFWSQKS